MRDAGTLEERAKQITGIDLKTVAVEHGTGVAEDDGEYTIEAASADINRHFQQAGRLLGNGLHMDYWRVQGNRDADEVKVEAVVLAQDHEGYFSMSKVLPHAVIKHRDWKALYIGTLDIAGMKIPCAVLEDERRVVTENAVLTILGSRSGASRRIKYSEREKGRGPLPIFLAPKRLKPYINEHLGDGPMGTIEYRHKSQIVSSYDCRILPKICRVWIEAALNGDPMSQQIRNFSLGHAHSLMNSINKFSA